MTETLTRAATATDTALADAIETLSTLMLARRHLPELAAIELDFQTYTNAWTLRAQTGHTGDEAADIDAVRTWADALTGGQTRLEEPFVGTRYGFRTLAATGTLGGCTTVEVWTHIAKTTGTGQTDDTES
jgi:hypothetical protein